MEQLQESTDRPAATAASARLVLNAGSGPRTARQLHPGFRSPGWRETRIDVDPAAEPDVVGSITDMTEPFAANSFDAVWCSHVLEHLFTHQVPAALAEFRRVLKPDGFALVTSPDVEAVAALIVERGLDHVAYVSLAGPISTLDILYGHTTSIARGRTSMAHHTGFSSASLGQRLIDAGFSSVLVKQEQFDLWALALMAEADKPAIQTLLRAAGLDMFDAGE
jgi:SAM-dependent methyltransferase